MKTKTKEVFYCDYCKKHGLSKAAMVHHEAICYGNPENKRPCFNCQYLTKRETTIYGNYFNGSEWEREVNLFYCRAKEIFLYTPKNQVKGNQFDIGDTNDPMPKECDVYKEISLFNF